MVGCFVLAALSLLLPARGLHFDSWAWVVWGREIPLLELDTLGGPSWKPFPVVFTTIFAPFSKIDDGIPPMLWLIVARAGGFLSIAMAYRLASRLVGDEPWLKVTAGVVAAAVMCITPRWGLLIAQGFTEPLAAGLLLWAIERHLDGHRGQAFFLGFLVALNRPEFWPFLAAYAVFMWLKEPEHRLLVAACLVLLPVMWIVPEWIGSGDPLSAGKQARSEPGWSLSRQDHPWLAALLRSAGLMLHPLKLCALFGVIWGIRTRNWPVIWMGGAVAFWLVLVAVMTQGGFSGNPRYFLLAVGVTTVLAGIGVARLIALGTQHAGARGHSRGAGPGDRSVRLPARAVRLARGLLRGGQREAQPLARGGRRRGRRPQADRARQGARQPRLHPAHGLGDEGAHPRAAAPGRAAPDRVHRQVPPLRPRRWRSSSARRSKTLAQVGPWRVLDVRGTPPDGFVGPVVAPR